jgi:hypothetical protein
MSSPTCFLENRGSCGWWSRRRRSDAPQGVDFNFSSPNHRPTNHPLSYQHSNPLIHRLNKQSNAFYRSSTMPKPKASTRKRVSESPGPATKRARPSTPTPGSKGASSSKPPTTPKKDLVWVRDPVLAQPAPSESPYVHKKAFALFKDIDVPSEAMLLLISRTKINSGQRQQSFGSRTSLASVAKPQRGSKTSFGMSTTTRHFQTATKSSSAFG